MPYYPSDSEDEVEFPSGISDEVFGLTSLCSCLVFGLQDRVRIREYFGVPGRLRSVGEIHCPDFDTEARIRFLGSTWKIREAILVQDNAAMNFSALRAVAFCVLMFLDRPSSRQRRSRIALSPPRGHACESEAH